jgi:hypothetical protein
VSTSRRSLKWFTSMAAMLGVGAKQEQDTTTMSICAAAAAGGPPSQLLLLAATTLIEACRYDTPACSAVQMPGINSAHAWGMHARGQWAAAAETPLRRSMQALPAAHLLRVDVGLGQQVLHHLVQHHLALVQARAQRRAQVAVLCARMPDASDLKKRKKSNGPEAPLRVSATHRRPLDMLPGLHPPGARPHMAAAALSACKSLGACTPSV